MPASAHSLLHAVDTLLCRMQKFTSEANDLYQRSLAKFIWMTEPLNIVYLAAGDIDKLYLIVFYIRAPRSKTFTALDLPC